MSKGLTPIETRVATYLKVILKSNDIETIHREARMALRICEEERVK